MKAKNTAISFAVLAAALYALNIPFSKLLLTRVEPTMMAAFLSCSNKPHDVAFIFAPDKGKLHHMSFFVESWAQVLTAADTIANHEVSHEIGPTRHGITRGETLYFFDPSGNRNEVFSGGYIWYSDRPTLTWTADELPRAIFFTERKLSETFFNVMT